MQYRSIYILMITIFLSYSPTVLHAEDLASETDPPAMGDVPVDGGLSLLLAAGATYGVRRVRRKKVTYEKSK